MDGIIDYKLILDEMFDDIVIVSSEGIVLYVSEGFERNYLVDRTEVIGKTVDEMEKNNIFYPSTAKMVFEKKGKVITSNRNKRGDSLIVHGIPIFENGKIKYSISYVISVDEISMLEVEKKILEDKLEECRCAYSKLKNDFNLLNGRIVDLNGSKSALQIINKIKPYNVSVLFTGESGVGKTTYAKYLHDNGVNQDGPFIEISCGAIPENLLESELFGYKEGAFTGASKTGKTGLIEEANHGTLFLDEIAELSVKLQAKLLKVLQNKTLTRLGDTKEIDVDFRLITATNRDLKKMVAEGDFREDLFYRINVINIDIPPLRERIDDTVGLIKFFLDKFNHKYNEKKTISRDCFNHLLNYDWPGNIRELENTLERLIIISETDNIEVEDLPYNISGIGDSHDSADEENECSLVQLVENYERRIILDAVKKYKTTVKVAEALGISQPTAARKIKLYLQPGKKDN